MATSVAGAYCMGAQRDALRVRLDQAVIDAIPVDACLRKPPIYGMVAYATERAFVPEDVR